MQKLDLGVEYEPEADQSSPKSGEPLTAEPVATSQPRRAAAPIDTQSTSAPTTTTTRSSMPMKKNNSVSIMIAVIALIAGSATGVGAYKLQSKADPIGAGAPLQQIADSSAKNGDVFGSQQADSFKDSAEGYLQIGGLDGEGSHHLLRAGGDDQTVYLVSTVTDLDKFDGMSVKVWGDTYKGQKVGWLMDVGRIQIIDTKGTPPADSTATQPSSQDDQDQ